jgi:hypothetical protein
MRVVIASAFTSIAAISLVMGGCTLLPKTEVKAPITTQSPVAIEKQSLEPTAQGSQPSSQNLNCTEEVKTFISDNSNAPVTAQFRDDCPTFADSYFNSFNKIGTGPVSVYVDNGKFTQVNLPKVEGSRFDNYIDFAIAEVVKSGVKPKEIKSRFYINLDIDGNLSPESKNGLVDYNY